MSDIGHILMQARDGEFSLLDSEARTMSVEQFAEKHGAPVTPWGHAPDGTRPYRCVTVDGTEYLWRVGDGLYDGWDRPL